MRKNSMLMLLPFAIIVTGCSGNLKKGSIFNEKFMKKNFGAEVEESHEFTAPEKFELNFDSGVTAEVDTNPLLFKTSKDGVLGYYSIATDSHVLPLSEGVTSELTRQSVVAAGGSSIQVLYGSKTVEEKDIIIIYDEFGNKLYEGKKGQTAFSLTKVNKLEAREKGRFTLQVEVGGTLVAVAYYNVDGSLKEVLSNEQYYAANPYMQYGSNLKHYGYENLWAKEVSYGEEARYNVYDAKKGKYVASFTVPEAATGRLRMKDKLIYQIKEKLPERAKKYDYSDGEDKYNISTYSVSYLTGKTKQIKTKLVFNANAPTSLLNKKGIYEYVHLSQVKSIGKDKVLSPVERDIVVNEKLKEVADVTGTRLTSLVPYEKDYYVNGEGVVYDNKLKEVGLIRDKNSGLQHIVKVDARYGLVNHKGEFVAEPIYKKITMSVDKSHYFLESDTAFKFVVMNEKEEVSLIKEISKEEYTYGNNAFSKYYSFVKKEDSSKVLFDSYTGEEVVIQEGLDVMYLENAGLFSGLLSSLTINCEVYLKDGKFTIIRSKDKVNRSYPSNK